MAPCAELAVMNEGTPLNFGIPDCYVGSLLGHELLHYVEVASWGCALLACMDSLYNR